jgi:hypothetical protein
MYTNALCLQKCINWKKIWCFQLGSSTQKFPFINFASKRLTILFNWTLCKQVIMFKICELLLRPEICEKYFLSLPQKLYKLRQLSLHIFWGKCVYFSIFDLNDNIELICLSFLREREEIFFTYFRPKTYHEKIV